MGTTQTGLVTNSVIVGLGMYTGGSSVIQYTITSHKKAKALSAMSAVFSTSAIFSEYGYSHKNFVSINTKGSSIIKSDNGI